MPLQLYFLSQTFETYVYDIKFHLSQLSTFLNDCGGTTEGYFKGKLATELCHENKQTILIWEC